VRILFVPLSFSLFSSPSLILSSSHSISHLNGGEMKSDLMSNYHDYYPTHSLRVWLIQLSKRKKEDIKRRKDSANTLSSCSDLQSAPTWTVQSSLRKHCVESSSSPCDLILHPPASHNLSLSNQSPSLWNGRILQIIECPMQDRYRYTVRVKMQTEELSFFSSKIAMRY